MGVATRAGTLDGDVGDATVLLLEIVEELLELAVVGGSERHTGSGHFRDLLWWCNHGACLAAGGKFKGPRARARMERPVSGMGGATTTVEAEAKEKAEEVMVVVSLM